jgi:hypothetical protein
MNRRFKQRIFAAVAVAAVVAGGTVAAVTSAKPADNKRAHQPPGTALIDDAASYLGITPAHLRQELLSGRSLGQVADLTTGKSAVGLIEDLEAARKAELERAAKNVNATITRDVNRIGGPLASRARLPVRAVISYLQLTPAQLRSELKAGRTLAEIANSTPGRSEAGLIAAIVAARTQALAAAVSKGTITQAAANQRLPGLQTRVKALVDRPDPHAGVARRTRTRLGSRTKAAPQD